MMLKDAFTAVVDLYNTEGTKAENLWTEINTAYSYKKRYYHNLQHLENMYAELLLCKHLVSDWDTIIFSLVYHDIIYKATAKDNEEKSADAAVKRLTEINYPESRVQLCKQQILATKSHDVRSDNDTNLFTDADLAILGSDWESYTQYFKQVRTEYAIYPDFMYNPGRKKVLQHFLAMNTIFKTAVFKDKLELKAKSNIEREITLLF